MQQQDCLPASLDGVCVGHVELGQLGPGARITYLPRIEHNAKTRIRILNALPGSYQVRVHSSCVCNELVSLHNRHLVDRTYLPFNEVIHNRAWRKAGLPVEFVTPLTTRQVVDLYSGPKKKAYYKAWMELSQEGYSSRLAKVSMFVKPDKYSADGVLDKAPRAIQYRSRHYNLLLASFLHPVEQFCYKNIKIDGSRVIVKGLSPLDRGHLFQFKKSKFKDPIYFEIDHSKFDSTVRVEHLRALHKYYRKFHPRSTMLARLLRAQLRNTGKTKGGIKYTVEGTRMSGDYDTGLGNSILNYVVLAGWLRECGITRYDIMLDGDDSIVIVEAMMEAKAQPLVFAQLGFETKFAIKYSEHDVDFCQCRFMSEPVPNFVRNPLRMMSGINISLRSYSIKYYARLTKGIGLCEQALNPGIPIVQALARHYTKITERPVFNQQQKLRMQGTKWKMKPTNVTSEARYQYYQCWGIDPAMQEAIECEITGPLYFEREVQDSVKYNYVATSSTVLRAAQRFSTLGTSCSECWRALGRRSL